jgi:hypothetical protein
MSDAWTIRLTLFLAGVVPFALARGLRDDTMIWPWSAGFLCQGGRRARVPPAETRIVAISVGRKFPWW